MSQPKQPVNLQRRRLVLGTLAALGASSVHAATWQKLCAGSGGANTWRAVGAAAGGANTWRKIGACGGGGAPFNLTIAANTQNYNIKAAAIAAGWNGTSAVAVTVTVNAGIIVGSSSTAAYAMDTGSGWPVGSTIAIVNNGYIAGKGGTGGFGGSGTAGGAFIGVTSGSAGGPALLLRYPVTITNASGYIYSGGGGGGGGGGLGGGGGGGAGYGVAGACYGAPAHPGAAGALAAGGVGGSCDPSWGYHGGAGGGMGASGAQGSHASGPPPYCSGYGGGHGLAITQNGNAITWVSGGTRVYGGVA